MSKVIEVTAETVSVRMLDPVNNSCGERFDNLRASSVNKVSNRNIDNRPLSAVQVSILRHLATRRSAKGGCIGHLPTTGGVIQAIGGQRDRVSYASVSRSLGRLNRAGLVDSYLSEVAIRGRGYRYAITDAGRAALKKEAAS
jgi:DNA-binding MarR family transcriptional regulator